MLFVGLYLHTRFRLYWLAATKVILDTSLRIAVTKLHSSGVPNNITSQQLQIFDRNVRAIVQTFKELGTYEDRSRSKRPTSHVMLRAREIIRSRIGRNPQRSMRRMGRSLGISHRAGRKFVKNQLQLRSYRMHNGHLLTDAMKANRMKMAQTMLVFTDEKIFTVEDLTTIITTGFCSDPLQTWLSEFLVNRRNFPATPWLGRRFVPLQKFRSFCEEKNENRRGVLPETNSSRSPTVGSRSLR